MGINVNTTLHSRLVGRAAGLNNEFDQSKSTWLEFDTSIFSRLMLFCLNDSARLHMACVEDCCT